MGVRIGVLFLYRFSIKKILFVLLCFLMISKDYLLSYATAIKGNETKINFNYEYDKSKTLTPKEIYDNNGVFLTFDDGPSQNTDYVLEILDLCDIKATFFVTYQPRYVEQLKEVIKRGHTVGIHCASHNASALYNSFDSWLSDFNKVYNYVVENTGYKPTLYRFPGGSNSKFLNDEIREKIIEYLYSNGFEYFDWNLNVEDNTPNLTLEDLVSNVMNNIHLRKVPVVLIHDSAGKTNTIKALPYLLIDLVTRKYKFMVLSNNVPPIHQRTNFDYQIK